MLIELSQWAQRQSESLSQLSLATTLMLTGLIWVIQLVHYPSFRFIDESRFADFHRFHTLSISLIVIPLMLTELVTGSCRFLMFMDQSIADPIIVWGERVAIFPLLGVWGSTFFIQVPLHERLALSRDPQLIEALVQSNWIRTGLWSLRAGLLYFLTR
ncbi:MAG: hypothetical protein VYD19_05410 [Myxococcota bacterium]|nr:hypothetical protein [Myxococcota bacterium]